MVNYCANQSLYYFKTTSHSFVNDITAKNTIYFNQPDCNLVACNHITSMYTCFSDMTTVVIHSIHIIKHLNNDI